MIRITRVIARLNVGGPAVHLANLVSGLDPTRFESHLVVGRPGPDEGDMEYLIRQRGIAPPTMIPELGRRISPVRDLRTVSKLVAILLRQRPHIVETHTSKAGLVGRLAARLAGVPVVLHVFHGHVFHGYFGPLQTRLFIALERLLARQTDRIITPSPLVREDIARVYRIAPPDKVLMIPLGLNLQPLVEAKRTGSGRLRRALGVPGDVPLVGFVGRLVPIKRASTFIQMAGRVLEQVPQARFVLVGDGELRPELERQIADMGLAQRVFLAGWQTDMPSVYADLDALVLTSLNEGTPTSVIEALAARVPVVATAVGGVPDVVHDRKTGLLVPPEDTDASVQAVVELLRAPRLGETLARAGQRNVLTHFSVERLVRNMESLYAALLDEKGMRLPSGRQVRPSTYHCP